MFSPRIEDVAWADVFRLPSVFDPRLRLYKEWHDFALYDRGSRLFALVNFGIHGDPYDAGRGYGAALAFVVGPSGKARSAMRVMPLHDVNVSPFSPDFLGDRVAVSYTRKNSFSVKGEIGDIRLDLSLPITSPPVTLDQMGYGILSRSRVTPGMQAAAGEMSGIWDTWVDLPKLSAKGRISVGDTSYPVNTNLGYHDHEGGRFDWGTLKGWDIGVLFCDPRGGKEPGQVSFMFYRYGLSGEASYGGIVFRTPGGTEKGFSSESVEITRTGEFLGERTYLPGVTRLLYPDYRPHVPGTVRFTARDLSDRLEIAFTPKAVCTIVAVGNSGEGETVFNEMFCSADLRARIGGENFSAILPCWFESVRPRGRLKIDGPQT